MSCGRRFRMIVGISRERAANENRVSITPLGVYRLNQEGHRVIIEHGAGTGSGYSDNDYLQAGGMLVDSKTIFSESELIVKVQGPLPEEIALLGNGQTLFSFLNLAANRKMTDSLLKKRINAYAFETLEIGGQKPILAPMSRIAGQMAPLTGDFFLNRGKNSNNGIGCQKPVTDPVKIVVIGAGTVGQAAARTAVGVGMDTVVLNRGIGRLNEIRKELGPSVRTGLLDEATLKSELGGADIVVGAICSTGRRSPVVISGDMLACLKPGAVIMDLAIDQGGIASNSRPTTVENPVFTVDGIMHYCVPNIPGCYPKTATRALANATFPYIRILANHGQEATLVDCRDMISALNLKDGEVFHKELAAFRNSEYSPDKTNVLLPDLGEVVGREQVFGFHSLRSTLENPCFNWKRGCLAR